jgi:hypothetical protein
MSRSCGCTRNGVGPNLMTLVNLLMTGRASFFVRQTKKIADSPFHSVRSVHRQFRAIVAELPFWYLPDFKSKRRSVKDIDFLHDIFADHHIIGTLQPPTDWPGLMNVAVLELVRNDVPLFRENAKSLHLQLVDGRTTSTPLS